MNILPSRRPVKAEDVNAALEIERARRARVTLRTLAALDSPCEPVHRQALDQFATDLRFADSDSVAVLKDLLADSDPSVRSLAARALDYGGHYWAE